MYQRYGLIDNPFKPADALEEPAHFLTVEGFGEQKSMIDVLAHGKITKSHFVLIHGISGSGRTSVSNYVASAFAQGANPLKVIHYVSDSLHKESFHQWMEAFVLQAEFEGFAGIPGYFKDLESVPDPSSIKYVRFLYNALLELEPKNRPLVAVFENVKNPQLFETVRDVFDRNIGRPLPSFPLVIFTSSDESVSNSFGNLNPKPAGLDPIKLRKLNGDDVLDFIKQKWGKASKSHPQPFDGDAIVKAFNFQQYPLKRAIEALNSIFEEKLKTLPEGDDWPKDARLAIEKDEIAMSLLSFVSKTSSG
jgi:hypothetical protein